jgi:hypothetical protein
VAAVRESLWTAGWGGQQQGSAAWLRIWLLDLSVLEGGERAALLVSASNQNDQVSQVQMTWQLFCGSSVLLSVHMSVFITRHVKDLS